MRTLLLGTVFAACMIFFTPGTSLSIDVLESMRFEDRWPDASVDNMAYNATDNVVYLAAGNFLVILNAADLTERSRLKIARNAENSEDITDPEEVVELSRGIIGVAADPVDDYVYLACGPQGIAIVDVSDHDNPVIESTLAEASQDDPIYASAVDYDPAAQRLYVADVFHGLRCIINVNDPETNPSQDWDYEQRTDWQDEEEEASGGHINVHIKETGGNTFAFVLDQLYGLRIFDVTNGAGSDGPAGPLASFDMRSRSYWGQYSEVVDVVADGESGYAYVSDPTYGVTILDFSGIPENEITNVGQLTTPGSASGVALSENNETLFVADGNRGMLAADVTDPNTAEGDDPPDFPDSLIEAETYAATGAYAVLAANGAQEVFFANGKEGLAKLGETAPLQYEKTDDHNPPSRITGLYVDEQCAYILDNYNETGMPDEGLRIVYLKDEDTGRSQLDGFIATEGAANAVAVYGSYAYVADGTQGVAVIDITDKTNPQEMAGLGPGTVGDARDIKIHEHNGSVYAYVADNSGELVIAEVNEDTGEFTETGSNSVNNALAVAVYEQEEEDGTSRYAAVVNGSTLTIFDVAAPGSPSSIGSHGTSDSRDVSVVNLYDRQFAIVADGANGIRLLDISDPTNPNQIDSFATNEPAEAISLYEAYIHAAVGDSGIVVLGIEAKDPPELIGIDLDSDDAVNPYYNTPGYCEDVFVKETGSKRYTYVADNYGGFIALAHEDRYGEGINEQPFEDSPDDSRRIECFISSLFE